MIRDYQVGDLPNRFCISLLLMRMPEKELDRALNAVDRRIPENLELHWKEVARRIILNDPV
jgi:hypothetical protein